MSKCRWLSRVGGLADRVKRHEQRRLRARAGLDSYRHPLGSMATATPFTRVPATTSKFVAAALITAWAMTWTKLGDEFGDECWTLTDAAFRLHVEGLCWSNRMLTDGRIDKEDMRRWAKHPGAASELVRARWWEDRQDHYQIVHHFGYQRTRDQIARQSIVNSRNGKKGGRPRHGAQQTKTQSVSESASESQSERDRTGQARTGAAQVDVSQRDRAVHYGGDIDRSDEVREMYEAEI